MDTGSEAAHHGGHLNDVQASALRLTLGQHSSDSGGQLVESLRVTLIVVSLLLVASDELLWTGERLFILESEVLEDWGQG